MKARVREVLRRHKLSLSTIGTDNVIVFVGDEASADEGSFAAAADEAVVVPVTVLEGNEARATDASNWLGTGGAAFRKQFAEAVSTIRLLVAAREALTGQGSLAVRARKALSMPWVVLVSHTASRDNLFALDATSGKFVFIAPSTINILLARNERFRSDWCFAATATETFLMPLTVLVFHLLRASTEHFAASVASGCELRVVTVATVNLIGLRAKLLVNQRDTTHIAEEASLMPVLVFVAQILGVNSN
jgi:hypothetical protein